MTTLLLNALLWMTWLYLAAGITFGFGFVLIGAGRIDPQASNATWGFRALILPGSILLWPLLAQRWRRTNGTPPEERTAHRVATRISNHP